jgi:RNA polymerase sigma-70 factor (ECF subfamily)
MYALSELPMDTTPEFEQIYREHYRKVLNLCAYLLSSRDAAEDAAQEVFLRVRHRIETYNPEFSLSNWILKISSNYCMDILRRRGVEKRLFQTDAPDRSEPSTDEPGPLTGIVTAEQGKRIRQALRRLPERFRIPLVLAYYNEFSYDEIAAVLHIPRNTVATLLFRGKQQLRKELKKE